MKQVIELFEDAAKERIKEFKMSQLYNRKSEYDMRTIHEAYQYMFDQFVDDVAKNTVANKRATLTLTIREINGKFSELTAEDIKKYSDMKKASGNCRKMDEVTQLVMVNVPKKALAKKAFRVINKNKNMKKDGIKDAAERK